MPNLRNIVSVVGVACLLSACLGPVKGVFPPEHDKQVKRIYVISEKWHTGIAMKIRDISPAIWPQSRDFEGSTYVEVGWGDWDYYQTPANDSGLALKAILLPTRSVVHVVGFNRLADLFSSQTSIIEVALSDTGFARLSRFIAKEYSDVRLVPEKTLRPGLYPNSRFYPARDTFHLLHNCNTWAARALRAAGCPITPLYAITSGNLKLQAKRFGRLVDIVGGTSQ